ncbi:competence protein A [Clostridium homopropionicum DSM 5847]|uniref:Competence protein A n=1 Tax=Clostridium homopropionicum DSM 5847 TaxID=1121318 RepID=A0A0L6ZEK7_9CLOT|nr:type IV pilus assembly protein PilM [Clostridium homopropionicum]KOA21410.1 competence protein A [Clostridium homopropionicum DSM 5847]SFG10781.1 type IV pilus assembly protein PilM [Clostridium homopropionicum]
MFSKKAVSIDIGSKNIKIVEGKYEGDKVIVSKMTTFETPKDSFNDGEIINLEEIKNSISEKLKESNIKSKNIVFSSKSTSIITRIIEVPWVKGKELDSLIKYEIEQYLPIDFQEYVTKYKLLEEFTKDQVKMVRANVAVYPKAMAKAYWDLAKELKLNPFALDLSSNAVNKLVTRKNTFINLEELEKQDTICMIDFGYDQIEFNIISKGILEFTRIITGGGSYLDANIGSEFSVGEKEAEDKKIMLGNLSDDIELFKEGLTVNENFLEAQTINASIRLVIDRWNNEINRMLEYFRNRFKDRNISKILIYGGTSELKGMDKYMQSVLGVTVEKVQNISSIVLEGSLKETSIVSYINAIGGIIRIK